MPTINTLRAFTWRPNPPEPGKRLPPELRERSFKAHRAEDVPLEIARWAVANKHATTPEPLPAEAPPPKVKKPTKAELEAAAKAEADARAKAEAETKAKQGGAGSPPQNPPPGGSPPLPVKMKFALADPKGKTSHVVAMIEGQEPVSLTAEPLAKTEAQALVADLEELNPTSLEDAKELAKGQDPA